MDVASVVAPGFLTNALFTGAEALVTAAQADESCFTPVEVGRFNTTLGSFLANVALEFNPTDGPNGLWDNGYFFEHKQRDLRSNLIDLLAGRITRDQMRQRIGVTASALVRIPEPVYQNAVARTFAGGLAVYTLTPDTLGFIRNATLPLEFSGNMVNYAQFKREEDALLALYPDGAFVAYANGIRIAVGESGRDDNARLQNKKALEDRLTVLAGLLSGEITIYYIPAVSDRHERGAIRGRGLGHAQPDTAASGDDGKSVSS
ncbi:MAG: hypothetical protein Q7T03_01290 [Deltaproteobacteria bacterium]|nr:hypothetical protein [Deltaproteobacteria bacterium]